MKKEPDAGPAFDRARQLALLTHQAGPCPACRLCCSDCERACPHSSAMEKLRAERALEAVACEWELDLRPLVDCYNLELARLVSEDL